jgi:hypothetical protein
MMGILFLLITLCAIAFNVLPNVLEDTISSCDALNHKLLRGTVREVIKHEVEKFIPKELKDMVMKATASWRSTPPNELPPAQTLLFQTRSNPKGHRFIPWVNYWNDESLCRFLYWERLVEDSWDKSWNKVGYWRDRLQHFIP